MAWEMKFINDIHKRAFNEFIQKAQVNTGDKERESLFYIFALFEETRNHINDLYDFDGNCVKFSGLHEGWQTGGTTKATKLAFNLYNNWRGEDREREDYSPLEIFSISTEYRNYLLHAVQVRFS